MKSKSANGPNVFATACRRARTAPCLGARPVPHRAIRGRRAYELGGSLPRRKLLLFVIAAWLGLDAIIIQKCYAVPAGANVVMAMREHGEEGRLIGWSTVTEFIVLSVIALYPKRR